MRLNPPTVPFLGLPVELDLDKVESTFAVMGAPYGVPYGPHNMHADPANAPDKTRERGYRFRNQVLHYDFDLGGSLFDETGANCVDCGNVPGGLSVPDNAAAVTAATKSLLARGVIPLILGGDDSVPPLCVRAYEDLGPINVLQIDAHLDYRDEVNGERHGYSSPMRRIREMPWVNRIVQVGTRGSGSARGNDVADALAAGNILIQAELVHDQGIACVTQHLEDDAPWFVTIDIDGMDPSVTPATSAPLPGGLTFHQVRSFLKHICTNGRFAGIDFVEHWPSLDVRDLTSLAVTRLMTNVMGLTARKLLSRCHA